MARLSERFEKLSRGESRRPFALLDADAPTLLSVPVGDVRPDPGQPRRDLGDLTGLTASIAQHGVMQPLIVSPSEEGTYLLIAGERRLTAAKAAGLEAVPVIARTVEEHQRLELQLIENLHRKDLDPFEEAASYQRLLNDYDLTQEELARRVGKSVAAINQTLRILSLPEAVREEFQTSEKVTKSVLLEIAKQPGEAQQQLWERAKRGGLTVKEARAAKPPKRGAGARGGEAVAEPPAAARFRYPIQTDVAEVTVTFPQAHASFEEIVEALEKALEIERERLRG